MFHWLVDVQHWLYGGMWRELKATTDIASLPAFMAAAFVFGMVHALMPGHGKSVLVSYHLGRPSRVLEGITTGTILALTHVGLAVVLVFAGVMVISRAFAQGGRAPAFDTVSAVFIVLIGAFLVFKAARPHAHAHHHDGRALAFFTGMVPCPLTTFILSYALAQHKLAIGLAAVAAMLLGVMLTLVCSPWPRCSHGTASSLRSSDRSIGAKAWANGLNSPALPRCSASAFRCSGPHCIQRALKSRGAQFDSFQGPDI